jgi:hypothetical protein
MGTQLPKLEALHTIGASLFGVNVDSAGLKYISAGDYYWSSTADGGSASLVSALQTLLTSGLGSVASTTVALDDSTGKITITWGSGSHTIAFTSMAQARMGSADASKGSASSHTLDYQVQGLWLPNVMPSGQDGSVASVWRPVSDRRVTKSRSGAVWATANTTRYETTFEYRGVTKAKTWEADESTVNESFESFWEDALNVRAGIFRHHADRTVDGTYVTCQSLIQEWAETERFRGKYDAVWALKIPSAKYVHVATGGGF